MLNLNLRNLSDQKIIELIIETGNTEYFGELYDRYSNKVFRKCCSMVNNEADAQDLAQNILLKAFTNIAKFEGRSSFSTWIYAITYNTSINFIKKRKKEGNHNRSYDDYENTIHDHFEGDDIENKQIFEIELEQLRTLMEKIKPEDKKLLLMKYQDNLSIEQIANQLDLSNSAVKMRLLRARDRVKKLRKKWFLTILFFVLSKKQEN